MAKYFESEVAPALRAVDHDSPAGRDLLAASAALLRLKVSPEAPAGLLAIGARRAGKFHAGQGTELLGFLAKSLAVVIAGWLDLPS